MPTAVGSSIGIVAYLALFAGIGIIFLAVNLLVGRLVRPNDPHAEKREIYECGEPTIGSSFVQFDLRFYVVALLFIIFDVEVAFFFPWATVFGKATNLMNERVAIVEPADPGQLSAPAAGVLRELGVDRPALPSNVPQTLAADFEERFGVVAEEAVIGAAEGEFLIREGAQQLAYTAIVDIAVFFAVLMVGFFYVWKRGDLDWVHALGPRRVDQRLRRQASEAPAAESATLSV